MRLFLIAVLALLWVTASGASEFSPRAYYSLNPYDDLVIGGTAALRGERTLTLVSLGYSWAQGEPRGRLRYIHDHGLGSRFGYDMQLFHEVQARSDLVPLFQTGYYEGRTGAGLTGFWRMGKGRLGTLSLIREKVWALEERGTLLPIGEDRIHAVRLGFQQDSRDDRMNPRTGGRIEAAATQAFRVFNGTRSYFSSRLTWSRFEPLGPEGALGWRLHGALTSGTPPVQRALWLAGEGVRGYDFLSDRGNIAGVANLEMRWPLLRDGERSVGVLGTLRQLQVVTFADVGALHTATSGWVMRGGIGIGLRAPLVALGRVPMVLRLDAAQGLTRNGKLNSYVLLTAPELF